MGDTQRSQTISTRLQKIAQKAQEEPELVFNNLSHLMDEQHLLEAYRQTRKDAAPGVDGITAKAYAVDLERNLRDLHQRLKSKTYKAPPSKRVWIQETDKDRPIAIPAFEDKLVQRATVMLLNAIYEQDFHEFSYGFIKGRNQHQALDALRTHAMSGRQLWVIDADVKGFFDNLGRKQLRRFIKKRVNDAGIHRLIGKWLNAGVVEDGIISYPDKGSPQGGVISPLLANIYLHYVLDEWYVREVQPRMSRRCFIVRFADDFVIGCESEQDARRIMEVLPKRFARYDLEIHPVKTRLINFSRPSGPKTKPTGTLDFLGMTHYWTKSRRGYWVIKRQTMRTRQRRFMSKIWYWCKKHRHDVLMEQYTMLCSKLRGYYQYYGVRSNYKALEVVYEYTQRAWRYWLSRRSRTSRINWESFSKIHRRMLPFPMPRIVHAI